MIPSSKKKLEGLSKILLLTSVLCAGCVFAKLNKDEATVIAVGHADVRICRDRDETTMPGASLEEQENCIEVHAEGISDNGVSVLDTLFFPLKWIAQYW